MSLARKKRNLQFISSLAVLKKKKNKKKKPYLTMVISTHDKSMWNMVI